MPCVCHGDLVCCCMMKRPGSVPEVYCDGGCGKTQSVRPRHVRPATWYVCGQVCEIRLPPKDQRLVRIIEYNAAGGFTGVTDRIPTIEERKSVERAGALRDIARIEIDKRQQ